MIRLYDLFHSVSWDVIETVLRGHYQADEDSIEDHRRAHSKILTLEPVTTPMSVVFETYEENGDVGIEISGEDGTVLRDMPDFKHMGIPENDVRALQPVQYGIEFRPWPEWLGMGIKPHTAEEYSPEEVLAHCLWEMTYISFDETEIQGTIGELTQKVDDIKAGRHQVGKQFNSVKEMVEYIERKYDDNEEEGHEEGFQKESREKTGKDSTNYS